MVFVYTLKYGINYNGVINVYVLRYTTFLSFMSVCLHLCWGFCVFLHHPLVLESSSVRPKTVKAVMFVCVRPVSHVKIKRLKWIQQNTADFIFILGTVYHVLSLLDFGVGKSVWFPVFYTLSLYLNSGRDSNVSLAVTQKEKEERELLLTLWGFAAISGSRKKQISE